MPRAPKKNVSGFLQDIKHSSVSLPRASERPFGVAPTKRVFSAPKKIVFVKERTVGHKAPFKTTRVFTISALAGLFIAGFFIFNIFNLKDDFTASAKNISAYFADAKVAFLNFNPGGAKASFLEAGRELESVRNKANRYKLFEFSKLLGSFAPAFKEIPAFFGNLGQFSELAFKISNISERLLRDGARSVFNGRGEYLIKDIEMLRTDIKTLRELSVTLRNQTRMLADMNGEDYLAMDIELMRIDELLGGILSILNGPGERHIAIFFQNPSEMRPSGGFIGSYADVVFQNGNIVKFDTRDIYDPDGQLDLKVIPPRQMQSLTATWGARDANWFFNFPTSAQKVLYFLEKSKMYSERIITFDGAIAVNANVVKDILEVVGPIDVPEYDLVIDAENFLLEIQEEVRTGRDRQIQQPKKILKTIAPILIKRLVAMNETGQKELILKIRERVAKKDIQAYFRDKRVQNFVLRSDAAGEVFQLPSGFFGDYLAVVNANIAGGKTDIFMSQSIDLTSSIDASGRIRNNLQITRTHDGHTQKQSWYRALNQNFIKIFTVPGFKIISAQGNHAKTVKPQIDYDSAGYVKDPDLEKIEGEKGKIEISNEAGKTTFGTWFSVEAGKTKTLEIDYEREGFLPSDGKIYQFVFEKQSGVNSSFKLSFEAPPGFRWHESNSAFFTYKTDNPNGRIIIHLTLIKS
ncbi:MAG: hypothetical protein UX23_C0001G0023 [Parcubacteria group bacterium GW2011_GWB1_45_9]|nr:MAG: hypothetical protein UX23_C0001G0023 [Parcubacteria group bacterium GW2011_GWB1_45_9]